MFLIPDLLTRESTRLSLDTSCIIALKKQDFMMLIVENKVMLIMENNVERLGHNLKQSTLPILCLESSRNSTTFSV